MDSIEGAAISLDSEDTDYGSRTVAYLNLDGDFVDTFEKYLSDETASGITVKLPRDVGESLHHQLTEILYGN